MMNNRASAVEVGMQGAIVELTHLVAEEVQVRVEDGAGGGVQHGGLFT